MRPLRLEIEGLTSFRQRQEIDFDGFDLFVITGPTGAGKTTILDAMTLALYGEIPRTGKKNAAELVTHGDTRARVMLEFRADSKTYRVSRVLPRNGAQKATLERREGDDWLSEVEESGVRPINARIEAIIGLDFDGFTRAALLPQGEFARFLAGDARQRRDILVKLLDLGRYERAGQLARQEADRLNSDISAKSQLLAEDYADATKEDVSTAVKAATEAKARADLMALAGDKVDQLVSRLTDLQNRQTSIQQGASALGGVVKALDAVAKEWTKLQPQEAETDAALLGAKTSLEESKTVHGKAAAVLEAVRGRTGDESLLAALDSACATAARETKAVADLTKAISAADQDLDRHTRALAAAAEELEKAKTRHSAARVTEDQSRIRVDQIDQVIRQARERAETGKEVARLTAESRRWHNQLETRRTTLKELQATTRAAEDLLNHLNGEHAVIGVRTRLTVGKPCPVCLQLVRATPPSASDIVSSIVAAERDAQAARQRLRKVEEAVAEASGEVKAVDRSLATATTALARVGHAPVLTEVQAEAAALKAKLTKVVDEREAVTRLVNKATEEYGKVAAKLASAKTDRGSRERERAAAESRRRAAEKQLKAGFPAGIPKDPARAVAERRREFEAARGSEAGARKNLEKARETHDKAVASRAKIERQASELIQRCAEQRGVLGQLTTISGAKPTASMKKPRAIVGDEIAVLNEWRKLVATGLDHLRNAAEKENKSETDALSRGLTTMGLSLATISPPKIQAAARKAVREASLAATRTADHAANLKRKLARRQEMEGQVAEARKRERLYHSLADELRQNRFLDYLLGESITRLAALASLELRGISSGRYGLVAEQSGFVVVDHANADETRSVDTLSGGETFLASLSLATALARSITDIAGEAIGSRLEAMFIDEGFGALDAEALDAAIDALERFRDSERLVGVITHVSQLAERIPDGLVVEREGASSRVRPR